jgi:hypothetical protein
MSKDRGIDVIVYQDVVQCSYVGSKTGFAEISSNVLEADLYHSLTWVVGNRPFSSPRKSVPDSTSVVGRKFEA